MDVKLTVIVNWDKICKTFEQIELIPELKRRMNECLMMTFNERGRGLMVDVEFEDNVNAEKYEYVGYKILIKNDGLTSCLLARTQIDELLQIIHAFQDYDIPQIFENLLKEKGLD